MHPGARWLPLLLPLLLTSHAHGQPTTRIRGTVLDAQTGEALAHVSVSVKNQPVGTITDEGGLYFLETRRPADTILFASVGYMTQAVGIRQGYFQEVNIRLEPTTIALEEVVVRRGRPPALRILDSVVAHKHRNDPKRLERYSCQVYNKIQLDLNNLDTAIFTMAPLRSLAFLKGNLDTNAATGKVYLPTFMSEAVSKYYYQRNPPKTREVIEHSLLAGVERQGAEQFTGQLYQEVNIYDNFTTLFNQGLTSPLHDHGSRYYHYFLIDSTIRDGRKQWRISFRPRRAHEAAFKGYMWVDASRYAVTQARYSLAEGANLNFINYLLVEEEWQLLGDSIYFPRRKEFFVDVNIDSYLGQWTVGAFGRKTTYYDSVRIGAEMPPEVSRSPYEVIVPDQAAMRNDSSWQARRPEQLTAQEEGIYRMIDTVKRLPLYDHGMRWMRLFAQQHFPLGWVEIGPVFHFYSWNEVEGHRVLLGARTTPQLWAQLRLGGYVGYGFGDGRLKWLARLEYVPSRTPWREFTLEAQHDMVQLGADPQSIQQNSIIGLILRREANHSQTPVAHITASYFHEFLPGLSLQTGIGIQSISPTRFVPLVWADGTSTARVRLAQLDLQFRWRHKEKHVPGNFKRILAGSDYPEIQLRARAAHRNIPHNDFTFLRLNARIKAKVNLHPIGYSRFILGGGYIIGQVPFPLLELHVGSDTYALNRDMYNMMAWYEFASDRWVELMWEHHFQGLLLNHIPLLRKLGLREVLGAKILWGDANEENLHLLTPPEGLHRVGRTPYVEVSAGIENILHFFRIDGVWRITHHEDPGRIPIGARLGIHFEF